MAIEQTSEVEKLLENLIKKTLAIEKINSEIQRKDEKTKRKKEKEF